MFWRSALGAVIISRKNENEDTWRRGLWWRPEYGGSVSRRNFDTNMLDYTVSQIRTPTIFMFTGFEPCIVIYMCNKKQQNAHFFH